MIDMELGPIRPPSEAESLMLRVTRGCHWNKCYFCDLYKKYKFSRRRFEEIEEDLKKAADSEYAQNYTTCFLQDGDAFVLRTEFLMQILEGIHKYLPNIKHVTTYARADSIARKSVSELRELKTAGIEKIMDVLDADISINDEATANVAPENEADLMNAVEELTKEKTIIMIAHRLKTVRKADQILVIEKGRIAEQGTHDVLLQKNGIYSSFICSRKEAVSWKVQKHS